jgi:hypothetical protein
MRRGRSVEVDLEEARRVGPRRTVSQDVCLFDDCGDAIVLESVDIGPRGVFVRSDVLLEPGQDLWVSLSVPGGPKLVVRGRVVRGELGTDGRPPGMGIAFVDLTAREESWLQKFTRDETCHESAWHVVFEPAGATSRRAGGEPTSF